MAESNFPHDAESSGAEGAEDETKRKFREALNRKMAKSSSVSDHRDGGGKQSKVHGPVESRREFRRKSG
jgi:hypothetical protein